MGHIGHLKEEYQSLVKRLAGGPVALPEPEDPKAWQGFREILEILYTPEEAKLLSRLPIVPAGLERLAERTGVPAAKLQPKLEAFCDRGVVLDLVNPDTGRVKYLLAPPVVGFFEFSLMRAHDEIPKKRMAEALEAYTHGDEAFAREVFGEETVIGRALVHETALRDTQLPDVLPWEKATAIVEDARSWAVAICYCRHKAEHLGKRCDAPMDVCLSLDGGADFVVRRKFGRAVDRAEAMDVMTRARAQGLVQIADNVLDRPTYICNCCGCCCGQLQAINQWQLPAVNPSGFLAHSDREACTGCSRCARACPISAITMTPERQERNRKNDLRPTIDGERCIGCGVCADGCPKHAMTMERQAARPYVPKSSIERAVRMALERGRLPHLLCDAGESRGHRFLNAALRALMGMPGAARLLATEQVRSRCVQAILARVKDPTAPATPRLAV